MTEPQLLKPRELESDELDWTGRWRGADIWDVLTAARDGDVKRLRALIGNDSTIVDAQFWYTSPIHFAVREGHLKATQLLVDAGADLTYQSSLYGNETLRQMALDRGHVEVADYLRGQLRTRFSSEGTKHAIHDAVESGDLEEVEKLLHEDPGLSDRGDHLGRRPLHYAVAAGRRDLVEVLLAHGGGIDTTGFSSDDRLGGDGFRPAVLALWHHPYWRQRNDYELVRHLLERGADYTIVLAAALGDEARVKQLLSKDGSLANDQESGGKRPLSAAAERNHEPIVRLLLGAGADPNLPEGPNCPGGYALWAASHFGHRELAEILLDAGADPNADVESSGTPTESAADVEMRALLYRYGGRMRLGAHFWEGNTDTIAALLDAKPEMFHEGTMALGFTHCVKAGHESLLRLLLARGLRVPQVVTGCQSYLWHSVELARLLLEHGMDPDLPNWQQVRPLHHTAARGEIDKAELFLEFGADPVAIDEEYRSTPLGWAARCGQTEFVRFLLGTKVDPSAPPTPDWAQPIEWARRRGHQDIVNLLHGPAE
jgi:ankyrin repeat protein